MLRDAAVPLFQIAEKTFIALFVTFSYARTGARASVPQTSGRTSWNAEPVRDPDEMVEVDLDVDQRVVLRRGLLEWGGPAVATDALAVAMGFDSVEDFTVQRRRLLAALDTRQPVSRRDWSRVLLSTEIVFASDVLGTGVEWPTTTGLGDFETLVILRELQRKLGPARAPLGSNLERDPTLVKPRSMRSP